jgi:hypothetical protein
MLGMATHRIGCGFHTTQTDIRNHHMMPNPTVVRVEKQNPHPHLLDLDFSTQTRTRIHTHTRVSWGGKT